MCRERCSTPMSLPPLPSPRSFLCFSALDSSLLRTLPFLVPSQIVVGVLHSCHLASICCLHLLANRSFPPRRSRGRLRSAS